MKTRKIPDALGMFLLVGGLLTSCRKEKKTEPPLSKGPSAALRRQIPVPPPAIPKSGCPYGPGDLAQKTVAAGLPLGKDIPIDHFIFVVQENRSFDHYFQDFNPAPGTQVEVAGSNYTAINPHNRREPIKPFEMLHPCPSDPAHDYESVLLSWNGGAMNGFALAAGKDAVGYFRQDVLAYYHALARAFALSDRHFADFLGPTWPNRLFMLSGTSFGHINNTPPPARDIETSLFHELDERGITWRVYADSIIFEEEMYPALHARRKDNFRTIAHFMEDASSGDLPAFVWVESTYGGPDATDEHPPANIEIGQQFVSHIIAATMHGAAWKSSLLILTYDEHGGFYDHVAPPPACVPDDHKSKIKPGHLHPRFDHLGMRVPLILVSPWAKRAYVSHETSSHTSLLRLVQARFDLPALTRRDANATPPYDMLDFASPPRLEMPELPEPRVEPTRRKNCADAANLADADAGYGVLRRHAK
jgi:phospholipase C